MSTLMELTVVLVLCPAALAIWADARYPNLRPREVKRTTIHLGVGGLLAFLGMRAILAAIAAELSGPTGKATALVAAGAVITYGLTVSVWIVRLASETVRAGRGRRAGRRRRGESSCASPRADAGSGPGHPPRSRAPRGRARARRSVP